MKPKTTVLIFLLVVSIVTLGGQAWGKDIKERMRARLPDIVAMKATGAAGENNQGYLTVLNKGAVKEDVVAAENQDRRRIYRAIAKQQGTTPELVGQRRALQIANKAVPGTWIQDGGGKWKQK